MVLHRVFFPAGVFESSFPVGMQEDLLSLLVLHRVSFPHRDSQGLPSLLVLHKFPILKFYHDNQIKQAVSEKIFKNKIAAVIAILDFQSAQS